MAYLGYGLAQGEGFIVITGDIGAGKRRLSATCWRTIDRARLNAIGSSRRRSRATTCCGWPRRGWASPPTASPRRSCSTAVERALHARRATGKRTLLIVDEAQNLPVSALEELRMLSNFQAGGRALVQIFLLGQPEFRDRLHGPRAWSSCASG